MLVFRSLEPSRPELLAVFVIGDQPDFGPNRRQFQAAIDGIHALHQDPKHKVQEDVPIVGPNFSGSIQPLRQLIDFDVRDHFFVVTGRATNSEEIMHFSGSGKPPPNLCFTVENEKTALKAFTNYVTAWGLHLDASPANVALLNEDETAYGGGRDVANLHGMDVLIVSSQWLLNRATGSTKSTGCHKYTKHGPRWPPAECAASIHWSRE
jgi:hypothetical protein